MRLVRLVIIIIMQVSAIVAFADRSAEIRKLSIIILALIVFILFRYIADKRLKAAHNKLEDAHQ